MVRDGSLAGIVCVTEPRAGELLTRREEGTESRFKLLANCECGAGAGVGEGDIFRFEIGEYRAGE